jgi:hypothetical protein
MVLPVIVVAVVAVALAIVLAVAVAAVGQRRGGDQQACYGEDQFLEHGNLLLLKGVPISRAGGTGVNRESATSVTAC